jgi:hypothetical protein
MTPRELTQLLVNVGSIDNLVKSLNINKPAITVHAAMINEARKRLDHYSEQFHDKEGLSKLSPAEQKALSENAQAIYSKHEEIRKELEYLDMTKTPIFITKATNELDHLYLLLDYIIEFRGKTGETILPHLKSIKIKDFDKATYKQQVTNLTVETETQVNDFLDLSDPDNDMMIPIIFDHLAVIYMWIKKEDERLKTEALPEIKTFKLPEEIVPELPKSPANELKN